MGLLVDGVWQEDASRTKDGHFVRPATQFRNWVTPDGCAGPTQLKAPHRGAFNRPDYWSGPANSPWPPGARTWSGRRLVHREKMDSPRGPTSRGSHGWHRTP